LINKSPDRFHPTWDEVQLSENPCRKSKAISYTLQSTHTSIFFLLLRLLLLSVLHSGKSVLGEAIAFVLGGNRHVTERMLLAYLVEEKRLRQLRHNKTAQHVCSLSICTTHWIH
jgi:hypothetical protein